MKFVTFLIGLFLLSSFKIHAQVLEISVADTALQHKTVMVRPATVSGPRLFQPKFDNKGKYICNDTLSNDYVQYIIAFNQDIRYMFLKKGQKLKVKADIKDGKTIVSFAGKAADACRLVVMLGEGYSFPKYFSLTGDTKEALNNYDGKLSMLDNYHTDYAGLADKIKETELLAFITKMNDCEYLRLRLALMRAYDKANAIDIVNDNNFQKLLEKIDVNDPEYEKYFLITNYIQGKISTKYENDPAAYGLEFVKVTNSYVKNADIKKALEMQIINYVIQRSSGDDIDKFWVPYKQQGDPELVKAYTYKIEAMKNTKSGTMAPDDEFTDIDGKLHHFSEYRGKLLYIDFWATWCAPCKAEIPHLAKLVERYKGNDKIQFISISVDADTNAWKKMITADKPAWPQFVASKVQNEKISKDWGIAAIPRFVMINPDGTINAADALRPSDESLIPLLDKLSK